MDDRPSILLINPPLWDFSAFDLWAKPLGLLYLAAALRANGYRVHWLDALDPHFPGARGFIFPQSEKTLWNRILLPAASRSAAGIKSDTQVLLPLRGPAPAF